MASSSDAEMPSSMPMSFTKARIWCRLVNLFFGGEPVNEAAGTRVSIKAVPELIWRRILFYEEAPGRSPLLLQALFLCPVGTEGDKSEVGARILCRYKHGNLVKRITAFEMPYLIRFDVMEQHLGIECCAGAQSGSYRIRRCGLGSEVILTTNYRTCLHPRWLWRPMEKLAIHQLHTHILNGMRKIGAQEDARAGTVTTGCACQGEEA